MGFVSYLTSILCARACRYALISPSHVCKVMGYSRDTFYRYKQAVAESGTEAMQSRR